MMDLCGFRQGLQNAGRAFWNPRFLKSPVSRKEDWKGWE